MANVIFIGGEGARRLYKGSMEENGTYSASGVLWGYSWWGVRILVMKVILWWWGWVMCMGRNVRVDVCSHVGIWIVFLIFV